MAHARTNACLGFIALAGVFATAAIAASTQTTLFDFAGGSGPATPDGRLLQGANGVLYGVSASGGSAGFGTVYTLTPPAAGQGAWSVQVIYSFQDGADGLRPAGGLIGDARGVLYGVTEEGGAPRAGTVFALAPPAVAGGAWSETALYTFMGGSDGAYPIEDAGLVMDAGGTLYGTTLNGGQGHGTAFRLLPPAVGKTAWTKTILHTFTGGIDGYFPQAGLLAGAAGVFYGTTSGGGNTFSCNGNACGTLFSLTQSGGTGKFHHAVLHSFVTTGGASPQASLISDAAGALYGTTYGGGKTGPECSGGCGTVFRMTAPDGASHGKQQTLHSFTSGTDSEYPSSALVMETDGTLWGTASGASPNRLGATFRLTPPAAGGTKWTETIVHSFQGGDTDGATPSAALTPGAGGVLYGVTMSGGDGSRGVCGGGCGTMFQITP